MTLMQLRYFIALADCPNFSRVAEQFFVAQAVVSYHIRMLEEELDTKLFERTTRSVKLTSTGRSFYTDVRPLILALDEACEKIKKQPSGVLFTIGYSRVCFGERFNRLVETLTKQHPNTEVVLERAEPEDDLLKRLQSREIDAAVFFNPYPELPEGIDYYDFGVYDQVAVVSEHHRFAARESVSVQEIERSEILACDGMRRIERIRSDMMEDFDNKVILLKDLESMFAMVKAKRGVACVPVIDDINITGLCYIPIDDPLHAEAGPHLVFAWNRAGTSLILRDAKKIAEKLFQTEGKPFIKHESD